MHGRTVIFISRVAALLKIAMHCFIIFFLRALEATELTDLGIRVFVFVVGDLVKDTC